MVLAVSCKNDTNQTASTSKEKTETSLLEPLPMEDLKRLSDKCTGVDYIFHELPISISQDDAPSIKANLNLFTINKVNNALHGCKSIAREFFQVEGNVEYEAEIYIGNGCAYHVWMDGDTPIYANHLSQEGIKFYSNILKSTQSLKTQNAQ